MQNDKRVYNKTLKGDAAEEKMVLAALLLVSVTAVVSGTDFEERISRNIWYRDYFNEVIYRKG